MALDRLRVVLNIILLYVIIGLPAELKFLHGVDK